jgi:uncharacterized protein YbjT (DUF2867 family)
MGRTAFVTGGTGFIGINLIELLVSEGWDMTALHRPTSNLDYLKRLPIKLVEGSITDRATLERAILRGHGGRVSRGRGYELLVEEERAAERDQHRRHPQHGEGFGGQRRRDFHSHVEQIRMGARDGRHQ